MWSGQIILQTSTFAQLFTEIFLILTDSRPIVEGESVQTNNPSVITQSIAE